MIRALVLLIVGWSCAGASLASAESLNLLGDRDFRHVDGAGLPLGYKVVAKVSGESGELDGREYVSYVDSDDSVENIKLEIPDGKNLWLSQLKPVALEGGEAYLFSVSLKWDQLEGTGPGLPNHGPGFFVYVHSAISEQHSIALVTPSGASDGWVKLQIPIDPVKRPDFRSVRLLFYSKDIKGTIWIKEASLTPVNPGENPSLPVFTLPDGQNITGTKLTL
jgi:hypothetical protein